MRHSTERTRWYEDNAPTADDGWTVTAATLQNLPTAALPVHRFSMEGLE